MEDLPKQQEFSVRMFLLLYTQFGARKMNTVSFIVFSKRSHLLHLFAGLNLYSMGEPFQQNTRFAVFFYLVYPWTLYIFYQFFLSIERHYIWFFVQMNLFCFLFFLQIFSVIIDGKSQKYMLISYET